MSFKTPVITVDGPSGVGKGTLCLSLSKQLGFDLLDSGAIYRALAIAAIRHGLKTEKALIPLASCLDVQFVLKNNFLKTILEGEDISKELRKEEIGLAASKISILPKIREALLKRQRLFVKGKGLVADGRDMGTVVFPSAKVKIFLDATLEERAKRRFRQLQSHGLNVKFSGLLNELRDRDHRDRNRLIAPLYPAEGAFCLDSTAMSMQEVLKKSLQYIQLNFI
ncbi:cytidylate kinase [Candidatus Photodesmus katoptron]|uniref:Cytidylate kinase n=1 Tax=Candidatus Photodesmus katoptron Akat1 TaxID=1236703 RepID=S3E0A9_9GAMM|nr:(d)CMP kinase [Candidatus Photodesmus katoptron]EPE37631.1 cytidylate kinase [Candidatus Photodesmus katoptron Akat1]KEY90649.1 cytidylate kinase [Candidatus Photodesmus katoptron]